MVDVSKIKMVNEFKKHARDILSKQSYHYLSSGSLDETALENNIKQFKDIKLLPKALHGISNVDVGYKIFNKLYSMPIIVAPIAYQKLFSQYGEEETAKASCKENIIMCVSMFSSVDYKVLAENNTSSLWLQLYLLKDRSINKNIISYAEQLGYEAIVLTVDTPVYAKKVQMQRFPLDVKNIDNFTYLQEFGIDVNECTKDNNHFASILDPEISWHDIEWLCQNTKLPIILKGIINTQDTQKIAEIDQIAGIVISNHGGRQLNSSPSPLQVLERHKEIINNKDKILLSDGGIYKGEDILKSLALGADAVMIGRALMFALAATGNQLGITHAINILKNELEESMLLSGQSSLKSISSSCIYRSGLIKYIYA